MHRLLFAAAFVLLANEAAWAEGQIKVATFNIQNFGPTKAANTPILRYLATVIRKFDIVAVQEVSDIREQAPAILLDEVNASGRHYELLLSERSGHQPDDRSSQEQYAFYFDADRVDALDEGALFDDSQDDLFQREPFTAHFKSKSGALTFTITQVHTRPESAVEEIEALFVVYEDLLSRYPGEKDHILLGDFNGSCTYARPEQLRQMEIRSADFRWVVPDTADTTVSPSTKCAYDRIVLTKALKPRFGRWGVADWFTDKRISDHWPVWLSLNRDAM